MARRGTGDTAMTRVAVWGSWAKLSCTPRLWEALSAVSTESWLAGSEAQRKRATQAGSRLFLGTLAVSLCVRAPCSWLNLGRQCLPCRPGEVVPASQDEPIPWCGCARQASEGVLIQSPSRSCARSTQRATCKNFTSHLESLKCHTTWTGTIPDSGQEKVGMCRCWLSKPRACGRPDSSVHVDSVMAAGIDAYCNCHHRRCLCLLTTHPVTMSAY